MDKVKDIYIYQKKLVITYFFGKISRSDHSLRMLVTNSLTPLTNKLVENWISWPKYADFADYADYVDYADNAD